MSLHDPYENNILMRHIGEIPSTDFIQKALMVLPRIPDDILNIPRHIRLHWLMKIDKLHIPLSSDIGLHHLIDQQVRRRYDEINPEKAETWRLIGSEKLVYDVDLPTPKIIAVEGPPGTGKSEAIRHSLGLYPSYIDWEEFPNIAGSFRQIISLSAEVSPAGSIAEISRDLMRVYRRRMKSDQFDDLIAKERLAGTVAFGLITQALAERFAAILHLDEVQNFFKIQTLEEQRKILKVGGTPKLRVVEDKAIKTLINFANTSGMVILLSGTPDGLEAMRMRLGNVERTIPQYFYLFQDPKEFNFRQIFVQKLAQYQYVKVKITDLDTLAKKLIELTTGSKRMIVFLWLAAHPVAYERHKEADNLIDDLTLGDFDTAAVRFLAPALKAIQSVQKRDPRQMGQYFDLGASNDTFWAQQWVAVGNM